MTVHTLSRRQFVPAPAEEVFAFFSRPENLALLTPKELGFAILTPSPIEMKQGALIDYTIRVFGLRMRWTTLITSYDPGRSFVDEQLKGPYSFWHHTHRFIGVPDGTMVEDEVRYALPFGPLGALARAIVVRRQLEGIFRHRAAAIESVFAVDAGGDRAAAVASRQEGGAGE